MADRPVDVVVTGVAILLKKGAEEQELNFFHRDAVARGESINVRWLRDDGCAFSEPWDHLPRWIAGQPRRFKDLGTDKKPAIYSDADEWYAPPWITAIVLRRNVRRKGDPEIYVVPRVGPDPSEVVT